MSAPNPATPRIALVLPSWQPLGVVRVMLNLAAALQRRGCRAEVWVATDGSAPPFPPDPAVAVVDLGPCEELTSTLAARLRQDPPDGIVSATHPANVAVLVARRRARATVPTVVTIHTPLAKVEGALGSRLAGEIRMVYGDARQVVAVSRDVAGALRGIDDRIDARVIPNPLVHPGLADTAAVRLDHPWVGERSWPLVVAAGRLVAGKDFSLLARAFALLRQRRRARLVILGDGPEMGALQRELRDLNVAGDALLPGFVVDPHPWFRTASVVVQASRSEGLGSVLVEALACGTPIVATDCPGGTRELFEGAAVGHLVAPGDATGLCAAIERVLDDPPAPADLHARARRFDADVAADAYLDVLFGADASAASRLDRASAP